MLSGSKGWDKHAEAGDWNSPKRPQVWQLVITN